MPKQIPKEKQQALVELLKSLTPSYGRRSIDRLAKEHGVSRSYLYNLARVEGIDLLGHGPLLEALESRPGTLRELAAVLGSSTGTLSRLTKYYKIKRAVVQRGGDHE